MYNSNNAEQERIITTMQNKKNTALTAATLAAQQQDMVELNDQDLQNVIGGFDGDFDDDFGSSRRSSFEKIVIIKRRVNRRSFFDGDFDD